jgi:hypothetical protein
MRKPPPAKRHAYIGQRKLRGAESPFVAIVTNAQIELPDAILMQGRHRSLDNEQPWRTVGPSLSCIADAQKYVIGAPPHAERRRNDLFVARQPRLTISR